MKKFLSLVLALIMTMSLVTISAGATEYRDLTDKDEIQYEEAVAVLNRIGVITGYEDGSFRPETELTRGAAAKIIVSLMIGPDAASALPNNASPYPDVPTGHTFAGVIGYCKTAGYISGYGDGTFKPANPLTGYAFAKMLLGAVGYKANIEGFVDTGWTMNVARIGNVAGLFDRLDFDGAKAVTRDEACQLALNTLKATMVDYGGANTVISSTGEVLTVQGSKAQYVTSNNREINANINRRVINAVNNEMTLEFGEEHFKDLRLEHDKYDPAYDVYGHPSNEWSYKKVTIGTFPLEADFTYTDQIVHREASVASKEKALGLRGYDTYSTDHRDNYSSWSTPSSGLKDYRSPFADATQITINGWNARAYNEDYAQTPAPVGVDEGQLYTYDATDIEKETKAQAPSLSEIADLTDNGVTVEVYVCPVDADFITNVVVTRTQLMKVKAVASDYVRLEDIGPDSRDPYAEADLGKVTGYNAFAIDGTEWSGKAISDVKDDNYDAYNVLKDMKAGDYVAIVPYTTDDGATWEVGEAYAPETVSGKLSRVDIYNSEKKKDGNAIAITVGGTSYKINEWNKDMLGIKDNDIKATRKDVTLYLAKDGTALWVDEVGNTGDWIVVADYYQGTNDAGKVVWYVHGYTIGGDEVNLDLGTIRGAAEKYAPGELVRYVINTTTGGGEYYLTKPNNNGYSVKKGGMYQGGAGFPTYPNVANTAYQIKEEALAAGADKSDAEKWEGAYRVALAYGQTPTQYSIKKNLDYIVLDRYGAVTGTTSAADDAAPTTGYIWDDDAVYYDTNPTFIYVSFDKTGELETIYFAKGRQDVLNADLRDYNTAWRNVGTNNDDFVASTAEAYVNDKGRVAAVVIKTDSADADLSGIRIITKNTGSNNYVKSVGAEGDSLTGKWNERVYVQGPDFDKNETGVFDKGYDVGDILVGNEKDGIFYAKEFHGDEYRGNSLDGFYVQGIQKVQNVHGKDLEDCFQITATGSTLRTLAGKNLDAASQVEMNKLLGKDDEVESDDLLIPNKEPGLIRCVSAKVVDVRVGHEGEITKLKDLLSDYDLSTVELKVLLNGKFGDAGFRNAYVIVILDADAKKDSAEAPTARLSVQTVAAPIVPVSFTGNGTEKAPYIIEVDPSTWVELTATPSVSSGSLQTNTAKWTVVGNANLGATGNTIRAQAPATAYDAEAEDPAVTKLVYSIDNYDATKDGQKTVTGYMYVELRAKGDSTTPEGETYNLRVEVADGATVFANGKLVTAGADGVYKVAQNANVVVYPTTDMVDSLSGKSYTIDGVDVSFLTGTPDEISFVMSKDFDLVMPAKDNILGDKQQVAKITLNGGITAKWFKDANDTVGTDLNSGDAIPVSSKIVFQSLGDGKIIIPSTTLASTGATTDGTTHWTLTDAAGSTVASVTGDANYYAASLVHTDAAVSLASSNPTISVAASSNSYVAVGVPLTVTCASTADAAVMYEGTTAPKSVPASAATGATVTLADDKEISLAGALVLTMDDALTATDADSKTLSNGDFVLSGSVTVTAKSTDDHVVVKLAAGNSPTKTVSGAAVNPAAAALTKGDSFLSYTKITLLGTKITGYGVKGIDGEYTTVALAGTADPGTVFGAQEGVEMVIRGTAGAGATITLDPATAGESQAGDATNIPKAIFTVGSTGIKCTHSS